MKRKTEPCEDRKVYFEERRASNVKTLTWKPIWLLLIELKEDEVTGVDPARGE